MQVALIGWWAEMDEGLKIFPAKCESGYPGGYPVGYLAWCQKKGWWGDKRIHLCAGGVVDHDADKVDIQRTTIPGNWSGNRGHAINEDGSYQTTANIIADGRDTKLAPEQYDAVFIDPPYSSEHAFRLYGKKAEDHYSGIHAFLKEASRLVKPGGLIITLSYEVPPLVDDLEIIARYGLYQIPAVRNMSGHFVFRKPGDKVANGLGKWL